MFAGSYHEMCSAVCEDNEIPGRFSRFSDARRECERISKCLGVQFRNSDDKEKIDVYTLCSSTKIRMISWLGRAACVYPKPGNLAVCQYMLSLSNYDYSPLFL